MPCGQGLGWPGRLQRPLVNRLRGASHLDCPLCRALRSRSKPLQVLGAAATDALRGSQDQEQRGQQGRVEEAQGGGYLPSRSKPRKGRKNENFSDFLGFRYRQDHVPARARAAAGAVGVVRAGAAAKPGAGSAAGAVGVVPLAVSVA